MFFGAILPQAFNLAELSRTDAVMIVAMGVLLDTLVQAIYLAGALKAKVLFDGPKHMKAINRTAASLIGGCALLVARR